MAWFDRFKNKKQLEEDGSWTEQDQSEIDGEVESLEEADEMTEATNDTGVSDQPDAIASQNSALSTDAGALEAEGLDLQSYEYETESKQGLLTRFKQGISKTRQNIGEKLDHLIKSNRKLDDEFFEEVEDILMQADVGINTTVELVDQLRRQVKKEKLNDTSAVRELLIGQIRDVLGSENQGLTIVPGQLNVILVVGVNGAGKTTSIAKMAHRFKKDDRKVILAAADTFRAAAIDQLQIWADRVGVEVIKHQEGADPGAVVYDAIAAARARSADILIIDTAGRLQNKSNLMKELSKLHKIIDRELPDAPREVLLLLDATTGQNAISQAKIFMEATGVSGIILSKLDGTAKGGIVIAIARELEIPVKLIGLGEGIEDLRDFSPELMARALFE